MGEILGVSISHSPLFSMPPDKMSGASFLTPKTHRLMPDVETDMRLYQAMVSGEYNFWKNFSLKELEAAGGGATLNWFGLVGAMAELNHKVAWSSCLESYVFNATKVSVIFQPA